MVQAHHRHNSATDYYFYATKIWIQDEAAVKVKIEASYGLMKR